MKNIIKLSALMISLSLINACATKPNTPIKDYNSMVKGAEAQSVDAQTAQANADKLAAEKLAAEKAAKDAANKSTTPVSPYFGVNIATIGDIIYFDTDSYTLSDSARKTLVEQARWLAANPNKKVLIAGNCDERGTREYNLALGAKRANAARDFIISLGIDANRIEIVSYGKERPIDTRANPDGWAVNRNDRTIIIE